MTVLATVSPPLIAMVIAVGVTALHRRVRPQLAASLLTAGIVGVAVAVVPTLAILAVGFLAHSPLLGDGYEWCRALLGFHAPAHPWLGAVATAIVMFGAVRTARSLRSWRRNRCADAGALTLVNSDHWFAYSLPGPGCRIALSSGLVEALDGDELEVVLAHEFGHARHRHDRQLLAAELAACLVPPLELLRRRLRFALERWADETAVEVAGGDRERVALTLAKVALGPSEAPRTPRTLAGFNGLGVAARVDALLRPSPLQHEGFWTSTIGLGVAAVALAAAVQTHHAVVLLATLCPG